MKSHTILGVIGHANMHILVQEGTPCSKVTPKPAPTKLSLPILLRSGIGAQDHLRDNGVPAGHDRPGVGQGMQDHLNLRPVLQNISPIDNRDR
jgi:hypothetical protein